jgi:hypothetical protein
MLRKVGSQDIQITKMEPKTSPRIWVAFLASGTSEEGETRGDGRGEGDLEERNQVKANQEERRQGRKNQRTGA